MKLEGRTALVTGANRGLGRHLAAQLRDRGVTVYAAARRPETVDLDGVTALALDLTEPSTIHAAARTTQNVSILINNAGPQSSVSLLNGPMQDIRLDMEGHYFGTLSVIRAFAPQLAEHEESSVLNILSVLSWIALPVAGAYSVAKAAEWAMSNALRQELAAQRTRLTTLHVNFMDTDMTRHLDIPKLDPADVATQAIDGIVSDSFEVVADAETRRVMSMLSSGVAGLYPDLVVID